MKIQNMMKIANVITMVVMIAIALAPLATFAQFELPDPNEQNTGLPGDTNITDLLLRIINIMLAVAGLVAVVFLIIGGFRYITAGGNEEASEAGKKTIINAIIGIVVIILSFVIVRVVSNAVRGET